MFCYTYLCPFLANLKRTCVVEYRKALSSKNCCQDVFGRVFSPQDGSDKWTRSGLVICTCRGSFSLKGAWEIPSDAPFISVATRVACNLRDIVADNRTCPPWTQRTISRGGVKSDFPCTSESISLFLFILRFSFNPIASPWPLSARQLLLIKELIFSSLSLISIANLKHCEFFKFSLPCYQKEKKEDI